MVYFVNSRINAISKRWHLCEMGLRFAPGMPLNSTQVTARYRSKGNGSNSHPKAGLSWPSLPITRGRCP